MLLIRHGAFLTYLPNYTSLYVRKYAQHRHITTQIYDNITHTRTAYILFIHGKLLVWLSSTYMGQIHKRVNMCFGVVFISSSLSKVLKYGNYAVIFGFK